MLFRAVHPVEAAVVRRLLGIENGIPARIYVLVEAGGSSSGDPLRAAVALEVRGDTWLIRSAHGVEDPSVAARVGGDLLAEAVRAGASTVATPADGAIACRALLADGRGSRRGNWLLAEL